MLWSAYWEFSVLIEYTLRIFALIFALAVFVGVLTVAFGAPGLRGRSRYGAAFIVVSVLLIVSFLRLLFVS